MSLPQLSLHYTPHSVTIAIFCPPSILQVLILCPAIPTEPNGGNHTAAFAKAAGTEAAHAATIAITKSLALTGYRVLTDTHFFNRVRTSQFLDTQFWIDYFCVLRRFKRLLSKAKLWLRAEYQSPNTSHRFSFSFVVANSLFVENLLTI